MAESVLLVLSSTWVGITGTGILMAGLVQFATRHLCLPYPARIAILTVPFCGVFVKIGGLPIAAYLRGVLGDVSLTTLILALLLVSSAFSRFDLLDRRELLAVLLFTLAAALFLYPLSMGITRYDVYSLGYGSQTFVVILLAVAIVAAAMNFFVLVFCITFGVLAYGVGLFESRNLWDYLIDPLIACYAVFRIFGERTRWSVVSKANYTGEADPVIKPSGKSVKD
jgi:hypothetical protein